MAHRLHKLTEHLFPSSPFNSNVESHPSPSLIQPQHTAVKIDFHKAIDSLVDSHKLTASTPPVSKSSTVTLEEWKAKQGQEIGVSDWLLITQERVDAFSLVPVVCGVWCVVCGVWCVVCGVWCVVAF